MTAALLRDRLRARRRPALARRLRPGGRLADHRHRRRADHRAARLPRRDRRLRLLGLLRPRLSDEARGPLRPRRPQLEGLLPGQHRPQGDRRPVRRDDDLLLPRRRADGDDLPRRAGQAGDAVPRQPGVQRPDLGARGADDLPVRDPGVRGPRELRDPADDRRAGHGVPAAERALVLAAPDRRDHHALELRRPRWAFGAGWTGYAPLSVGRDGRQRLVQHGRPVGRAPRRS